MRVLVRGYVTVEFPKDQIAELKTYWPGVMRFDEGEFTYFLLPSVSLPDGCEPSKMDLLLCPAARDGYAFRLYFSQVPRTRTVLNWNASSVRIIERNWHAFSWRIDGERPSLAQMIPPFMRALR